MQGLVWNGVLYVLGLLIYFWRSVISVGQDNFKGFLMERLLTEEGKFKAHALSKITNKNVVDPRMITASLLASSFILTSVVSFEAQALGVGAAQADSYIGEKLSLRVPLFNVLDPNSLSVSFRSQQFDGVGQPKVNAILDRSNSQLSIKLSSDEIINEPYVSFKLEFVDSNTEFSKEFTVLMDLRSGAVGADQFLPEASRSTNTQVSANAQRVTGSIMGPYDTAITGQIPEKFGAVLDGQSLWRVARRINEAMGVSRSQMMWGLYVANPNAFSSRSVSSLKAGAFLTIPSQATVKSVSHSQAKQQLAALRLDRQSDAIISPVVAAQADNANEFNLQQDSAKDDSQAETQNADDSQFQVTGIDSTGQSLSGANEPQSQQVIASLTETVGNLSQQLVRKDQKIEFLEQQVAELKSFIDQEEGVAELPALAANVDSRPSLNTKDSISTASEAQEVVVATTSSGGSQGDISSSTVVASQATSTPVWQWFLLGFFALSILAYLVRDRLIGLLQSLNLFGSNEQVEFNSVAMQDNEASYIEPVRQPKEPIIAANTQANNDLADKDYSIMCAVEKSMADKDVLDGISYLDLADDGSYEENDVLEFETEEISEDLEDLSFDERFERLLAEKDFDFARELLDFARYNEINDERYHCERLRLFEKMKDEDGFYEYYYEIESKITQISQLVVQLAHH